MEFIKRDTKKHNRNGDVPIHSATTIISNGSTGGSGGNYLPAIDNGDGTYTVDLSQVTFNGNLISTGEVSAYGAGASSGTGAVTIYDGLDSEDAEVALSANQGRILKSLIDNIDVGDIDLSGYYNKTEIDNTLKNYSKTNHTHSITDVTNLQTTLDAKANSTDLSTHTGDTIIHITDTDRTNWNDAYTNKHSHSNKSVLDGITSTKVSNWDSVYNDWTKIFTINSDGDLKIKVNVIGEKEISAFGAGTSSGGNSGVDIVDALTSTRTDAALSANQGRVIKNLIDNFDFSGYLPKTGGTITGKVTINDSLNGASIFINNTSKTDGEPSYLYYQIDGTNKASTGYFNGLAYLCNEVAKDFPRIGVSDTGNPEYWNAASGANKYTLLHTGNYTTTMDNRYIKKQGDTVDGTLTSTVTSTTLKAFVFSGTEFLDSSGNINLIDTAASTSWNVIKYSPTGNPIRTYLLTVLKTGNVGIGTLNPTQKLHIEGDVRLGNIYSSNQTFNVFANSKEILSYSTELKYLSLGYGTLKDSFTTYLHGYNINLRYGANGTDGIVLKSSGNVGIGTASPSYKLHINGSAYCSSLKVPNGGLVVGDDGGDAETSRIIKAYGFASPFINIGYAPSAGNCAEFGYNYVSTNSTSNFAHIGFYAGNRLRLYNSGGSGVGRVTISNDNSSKPTTEYELIHTGNLSNTLDSRYVNTSSDTMTGTLSLPIVNITKNSGNDAAILFSGGNSEFFDRYSNLYLSSVSESWNICNQSISNRLFTVLRTGNVGIGNIQPTVKLQVNGAGIFNNTKSTTFASDGVTIGAGDAAERYITCYGKTGTSYINLGYSNTIGNCGELSYTYNSSQSTNNKIMLNFYGGSTSYIEIFYNNQVKVGGNLNCTGEVTAHSDRRLKSNIKPLTVRGELNPVTYIKDGKQCIGFIADEVNELYSELVTVDNNTDEKYLSLNYAQLTAVLYAEIKELKERITKLENK